MNNKILITTSSFAESDTKLLDVLMHQNLNIILNPYKRKLTELEVTELLVEHQPIGMIAGVEPLTRNALTKTKNLKVISRCGIGMDSVDMMAASEFGIVVTNTPDAPTIPVAELTLGMILSLLRMIHVSDLSIRQGDWNRPMGNLLYQKTIGIIGCGRIGSYLCKLLSSFGCVVLGYDPVFKYNDLYTKVELNELISKSDIISIHIPYNETNHHFLSRERILSMKKGAILINSARGGLVDEAALYDALVSGQLNGAAIDCFENEPYEGSLKRLGNVLLTAHIGSYAQESRTMMERQAIDNLLFELTKKAGNFS